MTVTGTSGTVTVVRTLHGEVSEARYQQEYAEVLHRARQLDVAVPDIGRVIGAHLIRKRWRPEVEEDW